MGLEVVELTLVLEETFDLLIPDEDAGRIRTPREVVDYIMLHLRHGQDACPTQATFYRIRKAAVSCLGLPRKAIGPSTRWTELMPKWRKRRTWQRIRSGSAMSLKFPKRGNTVADTTRSAVGEMKHRFAAGELAREEVTAIVHRLIREVYGFDFSDDTSLVSPR